ncbi:MAG: adenine deaminase [Ignavibacteria bacterium]|nr:adenine deaminase [Ignavibacteria bacterium]
MVARYEGLVYDAFLRRKYPGVVVVENGKIVSVTEDPTADVSRAILPGFVDAHVHVESSMLIPSEFARLAVVHGTVATVSDPHEIGNVCGIDGVKYMLSNAEGVPFHFAFGAPSCVPATNFETAGAEITAANIRELFNDPRVVYLSEMMNWPGVLYNDPVVMEKLAVAKECGRVIDGHAPGLMGVQAAAYASHGITTDHECFTLQEALDKISAGMKILIREGSAARNFDALHTLLDLHPDVVMFCSDDMHPDALVVGHINVLVKRALQLGYDEFDVLRAACVHPVEHYGLQVGQLRVGDSADFIICNSSALWNVHQTFIAGQLVAENGVTNISSVVTQSINTFDCAPITEAQISFSSDAGSCEKIRVIVAQDGQLVTTEQIASISDPDILKMIVVNRYNNAAPAIAFVKGFNLSSGAIASSVAHDSHNVIAVGANDADIVHAINAVIECKGGVAAAINSNVTVLPLPVAGLMSANDGYLVAEKYSQIDALAKQFGSTLRAPFMTLSFMALLVIPALKLSDKGLFDGNKFEFVSLCVDGET